MLYIKGVDACTLSKEELIEALELAMQQLQDERKMHQKAMEVFSYK